MLDSELQLKCSENDQTLHKKLTEILLVLTSAEKEGQNLYGSLKQIGGVLHDLQDDNLSFLYERLLSGSQTESKRQQVWDDEYFAFVLLLCNLLYETRIKVNKDDLIPA